MSEPLSFLLAGIIAGSALGFVGAGGPIIGLPIILLGTPLSEHDALGTNAVAVSALALALAVRNIIRKVAYWREGLAFSIPGMIGVYFGTRLGLVFPGHQLIFILGIVIFGAAAWMFWLSRQPNPVFYEPPSFNTRDLRQRLYKLAVLGLIIGWLAGFFAIAGGFMIVIAFMIGARFPVRLASQTALIPIALFTALEGYQYAFAGHVQLFDAGVMFAAGLVTGVVGLILSERAPRHLLLRVLAFLFILSGIFFLIR